MTKITISIVAVVIAVVTTVNGCTDERNSHLKSVVSVSEYRHHEFSQSQGHVYVLPNYDVFVVRENFDKTQVQASLFTNASMSSEEIINKMVWILTATGANQKFMVETHKMLNNDKRIEEGVFSISLAEGGGATHRFDLAQYHQLNVLTYERI